MNKIVDITEEELISERYGGKAAGISLLKKLGFLVPEGIAIEAIREDGDLEPGFQNELSRKLKKFEKNGKYEVAIRSSCTMEDSFTESAAGKFKTFLGVFSFEEVLAAIHEVVGGAHSDGERMGIVIQKLIPAEYSGVIFSSNPLSYRKDTMLVSLAAGMGDGLVSGEVAGTDFEVSYKDGLVVVADEYKNCVPGLVCLCQSIKEMEKSLGYPLDVEWAIQEGSIYYLQCRPLSAITAITPGIYHADLDNITRVSEMLKLNTKLDVWKQVMGMGIRMPDTYFQVYNGSIAFSKDTQWNIKKTKQYKGCSAVILYPENCGKTCNFLGDKTKVKGHLSDCCRYGIRAFPQYENIQECMEGYERIIEKESWIGITTLQETIKPLYTGSIGRVQNGYMVEITHGSFITKGIVPVSSYLISDKEDIISKEEVVQPTWYTVVEGHTVYCICNDGKNTLVSLKGDVLLEVLRYFEPLLEKYDRTIEFALLKNEETGGYIPYFIDFADNVTNTELSIDDISAGIVSRGRAWGKIVYIDKIDVPEFCTDATDDRIVFFAARPEISLLPLTEKYDSHKIAFVFEAGSVLCHLATVLREKGIPAIRAGHYESWKYRSGALCEVDAESEYLLGEERIRMK